MEEQQANLPMELEEYMRTMLRIGFAREFVLEKCFERVMSLYGSTQGLPMLEDATKACEIHPTQLRRQCEESSVARYR